MPGRISIDFGTTNTVVAQWDEREKGPVTLRLGPLSTIPLPHMPSVIPSLIFVDEKILGGNEVLTGGYNIKGDPRFFAGFKRTIAGQSGEMPRSIGGKEVSCKDAGRYFLGRIWKGIKDKAGTVEEAIFTVPFSPLIYMSSGSPGSARSSG